MVLLRAGYLIKQPLQGHLLSRPRKRYFTLTDDHLEWFQDEHARVPKDRLKVKGARLERRGNTLVLLSSHNDGSGRRAELVVTGEDLDEWESVLRSAASEAVSNLPLEQSFPGAPKLNQRRSLDLGQVPSEAVSNSLLEQSFPDAPTVNQRGSLNLGQAVSSGGELGSPVPSQMSSPMASQMASPSTSQSSSKFSAFLTHDWGTDEKGRDNHARVAAVHHALSAAGLNCWFDEEQMQGDINRKMTRGIDKSSVVVAFITSRYVTKVCGEGPNGSNDNCKFEFDYALLRKGVDKIVACVMEPSMRDPKQWAGVVGGKLGTCLYVDLAHDEAEDGFATGVQRLTREINSRSADSFSFQSGRHSQNEPEATKTEPPNKSVLATAGTEQHNDLHEESLSLHPTPGVSALATTHPSVLASLSAAAQAVVTELGGEMEEQSIATSLERRRSHAALAADEPPEWQCKGEYAALCAAARNPRVPFAPCPPPDVCLHGDSLSHYKSECAMEARHCQAELERALRCPVFLDSDDLIDLRELLDHVRKSDVLLLFQSRSVLTQPYCLLELHAAIEAKVPIVAVRVRGSNEYSHEDAAHLLRYLDVELHQRNAAATELLARHNLDLTNLAYELSMVVPNLVSIELNPSGSRNSLTATLLDIVQTMRVARPPLLDTAELTKAEWLAARGDPALRSAAPGGTPGVSSSASSKPLAPVPPEVPQLPPSCVERPELISALKQRVMRIGEQSEGSEGGSTTAVTAPARKKGRAGTEGNTTSANGMGGVGKTTLAAALARDRDVLGYFDKVCWVSVGQEPDTQALQESLHMQLVGKRLPDAARTDERLAHEALRMAAKGQDVLLVLDDIWVASHATPLSFVCPASRRSATLVTTRIRSLLDGAGEVQCEVLGQAAALELLLRTGGQDHLLDDPPAAAVEAVEECGRLPLALGIAGGIIEELADSWQDDLLPLLKEEFAGDGAEASIEERVVAASLAVVPQALRQGTEGLFALFAVFAEDAVVPSAAIDVVAPLMVPIGGGAGGSDRKSTATSTAGSNRSSVQSESRGRRTSTAAGGSDAQQKRQVRRLLQQLLKLNLLRGTIEDGVAAHDLVRDCMIRRVEEASGAGGLQGLQRKAVPLLLAAFDADGAAAPYVAGSLHWHVRQAHRGTDAADAEGGLGIASDTLLMSVLRYESGTVRKQGALGLGLASLRAAADACDDVHEHLKAAELMYAATAVRGSAAGAEARRAWASLRLLEQAGQGTPASHALETRVANALVIASEGGFAFGSPEHMSVLKRMQELGASGRQRQQLPNEAASGGSSDGSVGAQPTVSPSTSRGTKQVEVEPWMDEEMARRRRRRGESASLASFEIETGMALAAFGEAFTLLNGFGWMGPLTEERAGRAFVHRTHAIEHWHEAMAVAPSEAHALVAPGYIAFWMGLIPFSYDSPRLDAEALPSDVERALFQRSIERYDYDKVHAVAKSVAARMDFTGFAGCGAMPLLLFWGDLKAARAGFAICIDCHKRLLQCVKQDSSVLEDYLYELLVGHHSLLPALLLADEPHTLREFVNSYAYTLALDGTLPHKSFDTPFFSWISEDGHRAATLHTLFSIGVQGLVALLEQDTEATRAKLRTWLPPLGELLRIAEYELFWRILPYGPLHPALLCAKLYGERLGDWQTAANVCRGVLDIIGTFIPLLRCEVYRLLGKAQFELGDRRAACEAAEAAVVEAARGKYVWLEMLGLRDLLCWSEDGELVRLRLCHVAGRLAASPEELIGTLGDGVLGNIGLSIKTIRAFQEHAAAERAGGDALPLPPPEAKSEEAMQKEFGLGMVTMVEWWGLEGMGPGYAPMTAERLHQAFLLGEKNRVAIARSATLAPNTALSVGIASYAFFAAIYPRQHIHPCFHVEVVYGDGGTKLREHSELYDFSTMHDICRTCGVNCDISMFTVYELGLLLFFGDLTGSRAAMEKSIESQRLIAQRVTEGKATAEEYFYEAWHASLYLVLAALLSGEREQLRIFLATSLAGAALTDEVARKGIYALWGTPWCTWTTDDGHIHSSTATWLLYIRCVAVLAEDEPHATSSTQLRELLPPAAELLRIAEYECVWRALAIIHPSLLCAQLYGERLGEWEIVIEVMEGLLKIEAFNAVLRSMAYLLLSRARGELGQRERACAPAAQAVSEAAKGKYVWLELLALRDLLLQSRASGEAGEIEAARKRLGRAVGRIPASPEELANGVLSDTELSVATLRSFQQQAADEKAAAARAREQLAATPLGSKDVFGAELSGFMAQLSIVLTEYENVAAHQGRITREKVESSRQCSCAMKEHISNAIAAAPTETFPQVQAQAALSTLVTIALAFPRQHAIAGWQTEHFCGARGAGLRQMIDTYDASKMQPLIKSDLSHSDFFAFGAAPLALLLFYGDVSGARAGLTKLVEAHRFARERVRDGSATTENYHYETFNSCVDQIAMLMGSMDELRDYLASSLAGAAVGDESVRAGMASFWTANLSRCWKSEDGQYPSSLSAWLLIPRGLAALLEADGETSRARLREWLPPEAELCHIAEFATAWRAFACTHPALLCARLHGEKLGDWRVAVSVVESFVHAEQFNPFQRCEAYRLLARARAELGQRKAACEAAEAAVQEAASARYYWLWMLSLRDLLRWCDDADAPWVRHRLAGVVGFMAATREEIASVLGEGALPEGAPCGEFCRPPRPMPAEQSSGEVMRAEAALAIGITIAKVASLQGYTGYPGPQTLELVLHHSALSTQARDHFRAAAAAAISPAHKICLNVLALTFFHDIDPRRHGLPEFDAEACYGKRAVLLREAVDQYDVGTHQQVLIEIVGLNAFAEGHWVLTALLFSGDISWSRAALAKLLNIHRNHKQDVLDRKSTVSSLQYEIFSLGFMGCALLMGDIDFIRSFLADSLCGATLHDEDVRAEFGGLWKQFGQDGWKADSGHYHSTLESWMLIPRSLTTLLEEDNAASRAKLREWLPPPAELLRIITFETVWHSIPWCAASPVLLCARLHGERLGDWHITITVVEALLSTERFNLILRCEAYRLLAKARAAAQQLQDACRAAESAVVEAARAKYVWLELVSLRDVLRWCAPAETEGVKRRLALVAERVAASREELVGVLGEGVLPPESASHAATLQGVPNKEMMEAAFALSMVDRMLAYAIEGICDYQPLSDASLLRIHEHYAKEAQLLQDAAAAAPDPGLVYAACPDSRLIFPRTHTLTTFVPDDVCGAAGAGLRRRIESYDFKTHHKAVKTMFLSSDFFPTGVEPFFLLLFYGDISGARAGFAKAADAQSRMLALVRDGALPEAYHMEIFIPLTVLPAALLALNDRPMLREIMANSLMGKVLDDAMIRDGAASFWAGAFASWETADGHRHSTFETYLVLLRALRELLDESTAATAERRAKLHEWLPPVADLLRITEQECMWRAHAMGANHPALLCARLYGERLERWQATADVVEGLLSIEAFHPLLRCEAYRLLAKACDELRQREKACEAAEAAAAEAVKGKYMWLELLALRDVLRWCEESRSESVRARLRVLAERASASAEELDKLFGVGWLSSTQRDE